MGPTIFCAWQNGICKTPQCGYSGLDKVGNYRGKRETWSKSKNQVRERFWKKSEIDNRSKFEVVNRLIIVYRDVFALIVKIKLFKLWSQTKQIHINYLSLNNLKKKQFKSNCWMHYILRFWNRADRECCTFTTFLNEPRFNGTCQKVFFKKNFSSGWSIERLFEKHYSNIKPL